MYNMSLFGKSEFVYLFRLHALLAHKIRRKRMWGERNNIEGRKSIPREEEASVMECGSILFF